MKKILFWLPRILVILFALFLSIFALDIFGEGYGFWGTIVGLFMHLIPTFALIILLLIAWKWEIIGGILFILLGVFFTIFFDGYEELMQFLIVCFPVFLVGILFIMSKMYKGNN